MAVIGDGEDDWYTETFSFTVTVPGDDSGLIDSDPLIESTDSDSTATIDTDPIEEEDTDSPTPCQALRSSFDGAHEVVPPAIDWSQVYGMVGCGRIRSASCTDGATIELAPSTLCFHDQPYDLPVDIDETMNASICLKISDTITYPTGTCTVRVAHADDWTWSWSS